MIKKLQALRAKKGFTLVELIVVIAIIGILAAILIPMMMGYVQSANITSADSNAQSARNQINTILSNLEAKGCTVTASTATTGSASSSLVAKGYISIEISSTSGADKTFKVDMVGVSVKGKDPSGGSWDENKVKDAIASEFKTNLADMDAGYVKVFMSGKNPVQATFTTDPTTNDAIKNVIVSFKKGSIGVYDTTGVIIGTNDKVNAEADTFATASPDIGTTSSSTTSGESDG